MADERPFHVITAAQVYAKLEGLEQSLARVESALQMMEQREGQRDREQAEQDRKVRALELKFYGVVAGLIAALTGVGLVGFTPL